MTVVISMWLGHAVLGSAVKEKVAEPETRMLDASEEPSAVRKVMGVQVATEEAGVQVFRGKLLAPAATAYEKAQTCVARKRGSKCARRNSEAQHPSYPLRFG